MSPADMLRADPIERAVLVLVAERADHWRLELDRRLARLVISEYAAATKRRAS